MQVAVVVEFRKLAQAVLVVQAVVVLEEQTTEAMAQVLLSTQDQVVVVVEVSPQYPQPAATAAPA